MKKHIKVVYILIPTILLVLGGMSSFKNKDLKSENEKPKPNIILFVADDHGIDALGCYGNPVIQTPNLDNLAANGTRFTNAYCTSASCAASRSVILTGKFGHATGSYGHVHDYHHFSTFDDVKSLPVMLEEAGYATARIGKYHVAPEKVYHFQEELKANPRNTYEMAEKCADVLKSDKPFFLYFCTDDPHREKSTDPSKWDAPNSFGNRPEGYPGVINKVYDPKNVLVPSFLPDTKESREEIAQYYQSISRIDQGFGKLMDMLKATGKDKNTIVIYISDNGMAFPGAKTTVYEPGLKLPCIIKDPFKTKKGNVNNAMISWVDLTPTILDMANVDPGKTKFHGHSFEPIIDEQNPKGWDQIYASHTFHEITMYYPMRVVRKGDCKLIWNVAYPLEYPFASDLWASSTWQQVYRSKAKYYGNHKVKAILHHPEFELFDLKKDPNEIKNLATSKKYVPVLNAMKASLKEFQKNTRDPWIIMWDHDSSFQGTGVNL